MKLTRGSDHITPSTNKPVVRKLETWYKKRQIENTCIAVLKSFLGTVSRRTKEANITAPVGNKVHVYMVSISCHLTSHFR